MKVEEAFLLVLNLLLHAIKSGEKARQAIHNLLKQSEAILETLIETGNQRNNVLPGYKLINTLALGLAHYLLQ